MTVRATLLTAAAILVISTLPCSAPAAEEEPAPAEQEESAPRNLAVNGDFEKGPNAVGLAAMWNASRVQNFADFFVFAWDDSVARSGTRSQSLSIAADHPDDVVHYNFNQYVLGYEPGVTYRASVWVRGENLSAAPFLVVKCFDRGMTESLATVSTEAGDELTGNADWTEIAVTVDVPEETGRMVILLGMAAPENRGAKAWFDDVDFVAVTEE